MRHTKNSFNRIEGKAIRGKKSHTKISKRPLLRKDSSRRKCEDCVHKVEAPQTVFMILFFSKRKKILKYFGKYAFK